MPFVVLVSENHLQVREKRIRGKTGKEEGLRSRSKGRKDRGIEERGPMFREVSVSPLVSPTPSGTPGRVIACPLFTPDLVLGPDWTRVGGSTAGNNGGRHVF